MAKRPRSRAAFWTDERIALLRRAWTTDAPSSEIAKNIGCTKNAACGKASRLGLPAKPNVITSKSRRAERFRSKIGLAAALTRQGR